MIEVYDWDALVEETYGRPYSFQQQDGCKERQLVCFIVPDEEAEGLDCENDTLPEIVNHKQMGVSFKAWLARDPKQKLSADDQYPLSSDVCMWWERNFYPVLEMVANDLHDKGLIEAGEYYINIDW